MSSNALPFWSNLLLGAYYYGLLPLRWMRHRYMERRGLFPVVVLFYHRVADRTPNDWTISYSRFEKQISWMQQRFDLISLAEAQSRIRRGVNHRPAISITFDDGYAENCEKALPLLLRRKIPFTYFVSTSHVLQQRPFPHDVKARQPLPVNTVEQLRELAEAGVEFGGHTRSHIDLGAVTDPRRIWDEVVGGRDELQDMVARRVPFFSFPYGKPANLNPCVFRIAREAGFDAVFSAYGGYNFPGDDGFHMYRVHGDPSFLRLKNWLMLDPRKVHGEDRPATPFASEFGARNRIRAGARIRTTP